MEGRCVNRWCELAPGASRRWRRRLAAASVWYLGGGLGLRLGKSKSKRHLEHRADGEDLGGAAVRLRRDEHLGELRVHWELGHPSAELREFTPVCWIRVRVRVRIRVRVRNRDRVRIGELRVHRELSHLPAEIRGLTPVGWI